MNLFCPAESGKLDSNFSIKSTSILPLSSKLGSNNSKALNFADLGSSSCVRIAFVTLFKASM